MYVKIDFMLVMRISILAFFIFFPIMSSLAQTANAHDPGSETTKYVSFEPRRSIYDLPKGYYTKMLGTKVQEYKDRMVANVKKLQKITKGMEKPQYSDPMYFGHKRKPKKRSLNKRRLCSECGIVH